MDIGLPLIAAMCLGLVRPMCLGYVRPTSRGTGFHLVMIRPGPGQTTKTYGSDSGVKHHECKRNGYGLPGR